MGQGRQDTRSDAPSTLTLDQPLKVLTSGQIQKIDDALAGLGPFAEVRLVKNRGKLRFIQKVLLCSYRLPRRSIANLCSSSLDRRADL